MESKIIFKPQAAIHLSRGRLAPWWRRPLAYFFLCCLNLLETTGFFEMSFLFFSANVMPKINPGRASAMTSPLHAKKCQTRDPFLSPPFMGPRPLGIGALLREIEPAYTAVRPRHSVRTPRSCCTRPTEPGRVRSQPSPLCGGHFRGKHHGSLGKRKSRRSRLAFAELLFRHDAGGTAAASAQKDRAGEDNASPGWVQDRFSSIMPPCCIAVWPIFWRSCSVPVNWCG